MILVVVLVFAAWKVESILYVISLAYIFLKRIYESSSETLNYVGRMQDMSILSHIELITYFF